MPFTQLRCRDLTCGDILLKVSDGGVISRAIALGQRLVGQLNAQIVHAGVMFDSTYVIEAQGTGVSANDLRVRNVGYGYLVFRSPHRPLADGAGTFAKILFDVHQGTGNLKYTVAGAAGSLLPGSGRAATRTSMDLQLDAILAGRSHPFFCSQLVVMVYQFAAEQNGVPGNAIFPFADPKVSPSLLAAHLSQSAYFEEIGYLLSRER
jgi:hypothetical protein